MAGRSSAQTRFALLPGHDGKAGAKIYFGASFAAAASLAGGVSAFFF
jgi:hypothetical protein